MGKQALDQTPNCRQVGVVMGVVIGLGTSKHMLCSGIADFNQKGRGKRKGGGKNL